MSEQAEKKSNPMGCLVIIVIVIILALISKACAWGGKAKETTSATPSTIVTTTTMATITPTVEITKPSAVSVDAAQTTYQANLEGFLKCWQAQDWETMSQLVTRDWINSNANNDRPLLLSSNFDFKKLNSWVIQKPTILDKQNVKTVVELTYTNTLTKEEKKVTISVTQKFDHNAWGFNPVSALGETEVE